jgi:hypothetical protein
MPVRRHSLDMPCQVRGHVRRALTAIAIALLVSLCARNVRAEIQSDEANFWMIPSWRLSNALHRSTLPDELKLCQPVGKSCRALQTLGPGEYHRGPVWTTDIELGVEVIGLGPFRLGMELSAGWGTGPPGRASPARPSQPGLAPPADGLGAVTTLSSQWQRIAESLVFGLRVRGESWRAFVEAVPGFTNLETSLDGVSRRSMVAIASAFTFGTRTGVELIANRWFSAGAFGGVGFGAITDVTAGVRLEFIPVPNRPKR